MVQYICITWSVCRLQKYCGVYQVQRLQSAVTLYRENKSKPQSLYDCRSGSQSLLVSNHRWGLVTTFYSVWNYTVCESWGALLTKLWVLLLSQVTILAACTLHIYMYSAGIRTMIYIYIYIYRAFVSSGMVQLMLVLTDTLFCGWICMRYWPRFERLNFGTKHYLFIIIIIIIIIMRPSRFQF